MRCKSALRIEMAAKMWHAEATALRPLPMATASFGMALLATRALPLCPRPIWDGLLGLPVPWLLNRSLPSGPTGRRPQRAVATRRTNGLRACRRSQGTMEYKTNAHIRYATAVLSKLLAESWNMGGLRR